MCWGSHASWVQRGCIVLDGVLSSRTSAALRQCYLDGIAARRRFLIELPQLETILRQSSIIGDPMYDALRQRRQQQLHRQRQHRRRRNLHRLKGLETSFSAEDVANVTEKVKVALQKGDSRPAPTVESDPQLLAAINEHRVNIWMTERAVYEAFRGEVGTSIGGVCRDFASILSPRLLCDVPLYREPFGNAFHFTLDAARMPIDCTKFRAVVAWVFLTDTTAQKTPMYVIEGSAVVAKKSFFERSGRKNCFPHNHNELPFLPSESHINHFVAQVPLGEGVRSVALPQISAGSVVLCDPFLLASLGPNYESEKSLACRCFVASAGAELSKKQNSWVSSWRPTLRGVDLDNPSLFPQLGW